MKAIRNHAFADRKPSSTSWNSHNRAREVLIRNHAY